MKGRGGISAGGGCGSGTPYPGVVSDGANGILVEGVVGATSMDVEGALIDAVTTLTVSESGDNGTAVNASAFGTGGVAIEGAASTAGSTGIVAVGTNGASALLIVGPIRLDDLTTYTLGDFTGHGIPVVYGDSGAVLGIIPIYAAT